MQSFPNLEAFTAHAGQELGTTDWHTVSQEQIQQFADATGDHQWIYLDADRAARESPYQTTIAPGFLTLSLAPRMLAEIYTIESVRLAVTFGANKIRFSNVMPSGSRVRMKAWLHHAEPQNDNEQGDGVRAIIECVFEVDGQTKPACVAELIVLLVE